MNNKIFQFKGTSFKAKEGKWIGSKIGFMALSEGVTNDGGILLSIG